MPREKRPRRTPRTRSQKSIESYPGFSAPQPSTAGPTNEPYERRRDKAHKSKGNPSKVQKHTLSRSSPAQEEDGSSYSSDVGAIPFESNTIEISEDEDDEKSSSKRPKTTQRRLRLRRAGSEEVGDMNDLNEETVGVPVTWKGKGRAGKRKQATISSSSDEDPQPRRKKFTKGVRPSTPEASDLRDEVDEHSADHHSDMGSGLTLWLGIIDDRLRNRSKTSIFQRNLERLKRRHYIVHYVHQLSSILQERNGESLYLQSQAHHPKRLKFSHHSRMLNQAIALPRVLLTITKTLSSLKTVMMLPSYLQSSVCLHTKTSSTTSKLFVNYLYT